MLEKEILFTRLVPVWLVTRRELQDQIRDWRVIMPLIILTALFPVLMNAFAREAVGFLNRFSANLIVDRLVPFSVLIIGFFPITVSLVVALESFVGEKERGTIEPLLSSPLENWQLYMAKLLAGIVTPLAASFLAILFYLTMVSRQGLKIPPAHILLVLVVVTAAHAILMVSAAIVISVQSTSVKAANLLASFIVIPVAILMQGETVLMFWGNEEMLWLAAAAVLILAALLIREGLAHFQREYLIGREVDSINIRSIGRDFWRDFRGNARSVAGWYRGVMLPALRRVGSPLAMTVAIAAVGAWMGYLWSVRNLREAIASANPEALADISDRALRIPELVNLTEGISAPALFLHNSEVVLGILVAGLLSFSVLGVLVYFLNVGLLGGVFGVIEMLGLPAWPIFAAGVVPHGILEVPALMLASAAVLRIGVVLVTPQSGQSIGGVLIALLADWTKIVVGLVLPLLAVSAAIEAYITPGLLLAALQR